MSTRQRKGWKTDKIITFLCGVLLFLIPNLSPAQKYPIKPVNIAVAFAPGGSIDVSTRLLASKAEKFLGQPFVISNIGGGGGSVGLGILAKEKPDGYHIGTNANTGLMIPLLRAVPYKIEDFVPIMQYAAFHVGLVVKADSPWNTLKELVEYARKNPGKVTYGTPGAGTLSHVAMEYIAQREGVQWTQIPYQVATQGLAALLGGHIHCLSSAVNWIPHIKQGSVRCLAMYSKRRVKDLLDVPVLQELGYDLEIETVYFFLAPKGTPPSIVKELDEAFRKGTDDPEFSQSVAKMDLEVSYRNSADSEKYLKEFYGRMEKVLPKLKIPKEGEKR